MALSSEHSLSLAGAWEFRPDGRETWQPLSVPGCWENLGLPHDWEGPGWYRRVVTIPAGWRAVAGHRLWLRFGAVSYACRVWVNGVEVGEHLGAWDAFTLEMTEAVGDAETAEIQARVIKPGGPTYPTKQTTAGFLPYVWGYLFGGIWQDVTLELTGPARLPEAFRIVVEADQREIRLYWDDPATLPEANWSFKIRVLDAEGASPRTDWQTVRCFDLPDGRQCGSIPYFTQQGLSPWSPAEPTRYTLHIQMERDGELSDERFVRFGFRDVTVEDSTLLLNDVPVYPRMPLSWGWYPETLHCNPPVETLRVELEKVRALGYNGVKCCLWVPPPAYLDLCDAVGLLVWLELPLWLPEMDAAQRARAFREYEAIVRQVRHHPCIVLWTLGCELSASCGEDFLRGLYERVKALTDSPLVRDNSGGGECYGGLLQEYADYYDYHFYCDLPFLRNTFDYFLPRWRPEQPWLFGEFCDADAFRDLQALTPPNPLSPKLGSEEDALTPPTPLSDAVGERGVLKESSSVTAWEKSGGEGLPWWAVDDPQRNPQGARWDMNITGQWANMEKYGLWERRAELKEGQRRQTLLHRKFTVELVRSYREMSGYVITGLRDTPISIAGMFDDFGDFRYSPEEFTRFNADTVLFLGWHRRRNWVAGGDRPSYIDHWCHWAGETVLPRLGISHYGPEQRITTAVWRLQVSDGALIVEGRLPEAEGLLLSPSTVRQLATLPLPLPTADRMMRLSLDLHLTLEDGTTVSNVWPFWIVPRPDWSALPAWAAYDPDYRLTGLERHGAAWQTLNSPLPDLGEGPGVRAIGGANSLVASRWSAEIAAFARAGGKAFVFVDQGGGLPVGECPFWREAMKLFEPHPLWDAFPHEGFTDLHFYGLGSDCAFDSATLAALFPDAEIRPLLRRMDARTFAVTDYLTEAVFPSGGRLLLTTLRPHGGLGDQPDGLLRHIAGVHFLFASLRSLSAD